MVPFGWIAAQNYDAAHSRAVYDSTTRWESGWDSPEGGGLTRVFSGKGCWFEARQWLLSELTWLAGDLPGFEGDQAIKYAKDLAECQAGAERSYTFNSFHYYLKRVS